MNENTKISVIVVEDDADIAGEVLFHLLRHDMDVTLADSGAALDRLLAKQSCDVLVLDLGLPGEDGIAIARRLAGIDNMRVVMLTARAAVMDRIEGFDAGADVYLTKPVNMQELAAVIQRVARRLPTKKDQLVLDTATFQLFIEGKTTLDLTSKEFHFLKSLACAKSWSMSRVALEKTLWSQDEESTARRMEVMISRLRQKLEAVGCNDLIKTEWRIGYRLTGKILLR